MPILPDSQITPDSSSILLEDESSEAEKSAGPAKPAETKPACIAITGTMGSGKSSVYRYLQNYIPVTDCDKINANLLEKEAKGYQALLEAGCLQVDENGEIDKPAQAKAMFSSTAYKQQVESILHPMIRQAVQEWIQAQPGLCAVEVPLLFESGMDADFPEIWTVTCSLETALQRLQEGRNISRETALERIAKQMPAKQKCERSSEVIPNDGTMQELYASIDSLLAKKGIQTGS